MIMSSFVVVALVGSCVGKTSFNSSVFWVLLHADGSVHLIIRCAVVWNRVDLGCKYLS